MGKIRGNGKKQSAVAAGDDAVTREDEKIPTRKRGRPLKPLKEEKSDKIGEEEEGEESDNNTLSSVLSKSSKNQARASQIKDRAGSAKEEKSDLIKSVGFRQNGSRRKNKPRRAAEVGVESK